VTDMPYLVTITFIAAWVSLVLPRTGVSKAPSLQSPPGLCSGSAQYGALPLHVRPGQSSINKELSVA